jgi:SNF2 family DNA or RNA helicase
LQQNETLADPDKALSNLESALAKLSLPFKLRRYQKNGVLFLATSDSAILADDMGLGKTVQTITAARLVVTNNVTARILIVVPKALCQNWYEEFRCWAPELNVKIVRGNRNSRLASYLLPIPVIIATYEQIRLDINIIDYNEKFEIVILDEAQRIKSTNSRTKMACTSIPRVRSWALSGTPLENHPDDLTSIFSFVRTGLLSTGMPRHEILSLMQPYFLRRTKDQALPDLPEIIDQEIHIELNGAQLARYDELWSSRRQIADGSITSESSEILALITRLKQQCNYDKASGESAKFEALQLILANQVGQKDKILIFSQYVDTLHWLSSKLMNIPNDIYHGGLDDDKRTEILRRFRTLNGPRVLLMSIKAGGVGLNLPEASMVILFDRWWNPATENQAIQRAHRFGRVGILHVIRFLVVNSIEDRINEILKRKAALFEAYIEGAENVVLGKNSDNELLQLLMGSSKNTQFHQ